MMRRNAIEPTPHVAGERDPLELIARLAGVISYRVPVEGRSSRPTLGTNDVAAALGFMRSPLERVVAEAVATQQVDGAAMERLVDAAEAEARRSVQALRPMPLDTSKGKAGAEILRRIIRDAAIEVVQPYAEPPAAALARAAKVRRCEGAKGNVSGRAPVCVAVMTTRHCAMESGMGYNRRASTSPGIHLRKGFFLMKTLTTLSFALAITLAAGAADAQQVRFPAESDVIGGLGEALPSAPNVSQSENFRVYKFEKDRIRYIQINTLDDEVLTAVGITRSGAFVMPVGSLARDLVRVSSASSSTSAVKAQGECPCSSQVVYSDSTATIVVVYGTGGTVIEVVVIYHEVPR